jgi:hypothetical protein
MAQQASPHLLFANPARGSGGCGCVDAELDERSEGEIQPTGHVDDLVPRPWPAALVRVLSIAVAFENRRLPQIAALPLIRRPGLWSGYQETLRRYSALLEPLYRAIHTTSGGKVIVDSMKQPPAELMRQELTLRAAVEANAKLLIHPVWG